jgi:hypothetical protein
MHAIEIFNCILSPLTEFSARFVMHNHFPITLIDLLLYTNYIL